MWAKKVEYISSRAAEYLGKITLLIALNAMQCTCRNDALQPCNISHQLIIIKDTAVHQQITSMYVKVFYFIIL